MSKTLDEILAGYASYTHVPRGLETTADLSMEEAKQELFQWINDEVIGKNYGKSIIGNFSEKDSKADKLVNETLDFANARLDRSRNVLRELGWKEDGRTS